jgi:hypothetical protein
MDFKGKMENLEERAEALGEEIGRISRALEARIKRCLKCGSPIEYLGSTWEYNMRVDSFRCLSAKCGLKWKER